MSSSINDDKEVQTTPELGQIDHEPQTGKSVAVSEMPEAMHKEEAITVNQEKNSKKNRVPRRVIHFSDGVIEEYSTDSEEEEERRNAEKLEQGNNIHRT